MSLSRRIVVASAVLGFSLLAGLTPAVPQEPPQRAGLIEAACDLPTRLLVRTLHGHREDRSGDIDIVPQEPDFVGHGGLPHSGPWDYVEQVPLLWYGPGYIKPRGSVSRVVTLADIAPTQGALVGYPFDAPDGTVLHEALVPSGQRPADPPRLVVVVVWDGSGRDVLNTWPNAWPHLTDLIDRGTWYDRAEVGSSPPSTAQIHATIGTGAFSGHHGIVAHQFRIGERIATPMEGGPKYLMLPTFADLYDRANANEPIVGTVATVAIQLGMMGHGSFWGGGDDDIAVLREREGAATLGAEGISWNLTSTVAPYFRFPEYVNDLPPITDYFDEVDRSDGKADGMWHELHLEDAKVEEALRTPARVPWQTRLVEDVVDREGFGADATSDLLFINYKLIDEVGHQESMNSVNMRDSIRAQDADLPKLIDILNEQVGQGRWVMALTADHGHTPHPTVTGATVISPIKVAEAIQAQFDHDDDDVRIVDFTQPTHVFINREELAEQGATLDEVSAYLLTLTKGELQSPDFPAVPGVEGEPAFIAAYPSELIEELPCMPPEELAAH
jgi:Type I phosphodiesterase / nucleotide pyrophosphatase